MIDIDAIDFSKHFEMDPKAPVAAFARQLTLQEAPKSLNTNCENTGDCEGSSNWDCENNPKCKKSEE